jgi:phenylpyruvate tautomerase PptA (4-oxalocrotonate tautomerase family)
MPLVRIDLPRGRNATEKAAIGEAVYQALISVGVPKDDRFQVISDHHQEGLVLDKTYLGIDRSSAAIMIQITWNEGRILEQKKALYKAIVQNLVDAIAIRPQDVFIVLIEVKKENWSFGNGEAQYAS